MGLEPCSKVDNLVVIQLNNTKLGQVTNLFVIFHMVVSIYKLDKRSSFDPVHCSTFCTEYTRQLYLGKCEISRVNDFTQGKFAKVNFNGEVNDDNRKYLQQNLLWIERSFSFPREHISMRSRGLDST